MCLLRIGVSFAMQNKPWQQSASLVSPLKKDPHSTPPPKKQGSVWVPESVCSGYKEKQWENIRLSSRVSSPVRQEPSLNLSFFTYQLGIISGDSQLGTVSASSTSQEDGVTPVRPLLWNGFERHLGRTGLWSQWLTYINSFRLPDNPMGPVLLLSPFVPTKTEVPGKRRDLVHRLADNEANWDSNRRPLGSRGCVLNAYFFGRRCQVCLLMVVPLSLAEANETSSHSAGSSFSLRKCRYGFFRSDYQWGGSPLHSDVAHCMD